MHFGAFVLGSDIDVMSLQSERESFNKTVIPMNTRFELFVIDLLSINSHRLFLNNSSLDSTRASAANKNYSPYGERSARALGIKSRRMA